MSGDVTTPTALVTGAGRRIGLFLVETLLRQGFRVIAHYRHSHSELDSLQRKGVALSIVQADLTTATGLQKVCDTIPAGATLNLLINNASIFYRRNRADITRQDYLDFYHLHVAVPALIVQQLHSNLLNSFHGTIINLLDARDRNYGGGFTPYGLSRLAARKLTQLQAEELGAALRVYGLALERLLPDESNSGAVGLQEPLTAEDSQKGLGALHTGLLRLLTRKLPTGEILTVTTEPEDM